MPICAGNAELQPGMTVNWNCLQVRKLWEALLSSQPEMQSGEGAARLEALVQARLVGSVTSTKRVAENKRVYEREGGFIMTKVVPGVTLLKHSFGAHTR